MSDERRDFLAELGADDRILRNSVPLSADGPIDPATTARVRKLCSRHVNKHGISPAQIASAIGEQPVKINRWRNGEDEPTITRKLNGWLESDARRRAAAVTSGLITTAVAERIKLGASMATTAGAIVVLIAPAGCGKSMVLKHLAERTGGAYVYCSEVFGSRAFLQRVCRAVGASINGSRADLLSQAVERLAGTNRPLFFDEAHRFQ